MANLNHLTRVLPFDLHQQIYKQEQAGRDKMHTIPMYCDDSHSTLFDVNKVNGAIAELEVISWVSSVTGDDNILFNNVVLPDDNSISGNIEYDIIWLSQKLITVIEVKAYQGALNIKGTGSWLQRIGSNSRKIANPENQCFRQCKRLRSFLKQYFVSLPVRGIIAFPRAPELIKSDTPRLPLLIQPTNLIAYLEGTGSLKIKSQEYKLVHKLLSQFSQNRSS